MAVLAICYVPGIGRAATVSVSNVRASQDTNTLMVTVLYDLKVEGATKNLPIVDVTLTDSGGLRLPAEWKGHIGAVASAKDHAVHWDPIQNWSGNLCKAFATVTATLPDDDNVEMEMAAIPGFTKTYYRKWLPDNWPEPTWAYSTHESFEGAETCSFEVKPFWMDVTEVTYAMFSKVVTWGKAHGYDFTPEELIVDPYAKGYEDNHPVIYVGEGLAILWCNARSEMEGKTPLYYHNGEIFRREASKYWECTVIEPEDRSTAGYRLPTCYEWSFAAHGGLSCQYPWGDDFNLDMMNCPYQVTTKGRHPVWGYLGTMPYTSPARSFPSNGYGLYDMVGNVWEMCEAACIDVDGNGLHINPGQEKCYMGGSWDVPSEGCEDHAYVMLNIEANSGFRSVCLSEPASVGMGSKSSAISNMFEVDTRFPEIVSWNVYGEKTENQNDPRNACKDPCLVAGSNYVIEAKFTDYNRHLISLRSIRLVGRPDRSTPARKEIDITVDIDGMTVDPDNSIVFFSSTAIRSQLPQGEGAHGLFYFHIEAKFDWLRSMAQLSDTKKSYDISKKVFFSRDESDGGNTPNWFVYWRDEGAVPALKTNVGYSQSSAWYDLATGSEFLNDIVNGNEDAWGERTPDGRIILHKRASDWHYWGYGWAGVKHHLNAGGIEFARQAVYGTYTVENVLAHESQHRKTHEEYACKYPEEKDSDRSLWSGCCDSLTDNMEDEINNRYGGRYGFSLLKDNTDTFGLGTIKDASYESYGDNEFVAMLAGAVANADTHVDETKDWAYPGHQSWLPDKVPDTTVARRTAQDNELITSNGLIPVMAVSAARIKEDVAEFSLSNVTISATVSRNGVSGKVSSIDYSFAGDFPFGQELDFVGYLADAKSNIVAISSFTTGSGNGDNQYLMRFDADKICRSGHVGPYKLWGLVVDKLISVESVRIGAYADLDVGFVDLSLSELDRKGAWLLPSVIGESLTKDGLSICVKLDVGVEDKYDVAVDLFTTNGDFVAAQLVTKDCRAGTNRVEVLFSPETLQTSGFDGPYVVKSVRLLRDCEQIDVCCDCVTTSAFKLSDFSWAAFAEENVTVSEGETASVAICGGSSNMATSVKVCLTHLTTDASDIGMTLASPLTVEWKKGEVGVKRVEIPIATDQAVEGGEFFVLQLADAQGQAVGSKSLCRVSVRDRNTRATLQDGAGFYKTNIDALGDGLWVALPGSFSEPDASRGLSHLETPALQRGQTAELTFGPLNVGQFCYHIRFTGNVNAARPSRVAVYVDDQYKFSFEHTRYSSSYTALDDTWAYYFTSIKRNGSKVRYVFTQGSDPDSHAEICEVRWRVNADSEFGEIYALCGTDGGTVSGSGPYAIGDTATLKAVPLPGYRFVGWRKYDDNVQLVPYSTSATATIKVAGDLRLYAFFETVPYVAGLSLTGTGGAVVGSGYCAEGQKVTLTAAAERGYAFAGWYANGVFVTGCPSIVVDRSSRPGASTQTQHVVDGVNGDIFFFAKFVNPESETTEIEVADRYGPFVPGEKVELKFPDGAAWKVTGLPTGLKWDAKLPGVTGTPTKPGTNTVTFTWTDKSVTPNVEHKASSTFIVGPLPVLSVLTAGEGTGKVSGAGAYAANKKVTLKATADTKDAAAKGKNPATVKSVFAGWYDAAGGLVAQTPSLSYVMPPHDVTLQARFIPASNDWATADCVTESDSVLVVSNETKVAIAPISVVVAGGSLPTVKVAGLPSGLKFTAKDILKKDSKTEVDIPANTIYGTPTKGGVYNATVTVTTAGKASVIRAIKFIIRTSSDYVADADWDPMQGKVTGVGVYQAGKKVTLKTTANRGYVFSGWYAGEDLVSRLASYVLTMPTNDVAYVAKFVTSAEDAASITALVDGLALEPWASKTETHAFATNVMCGVYLEWPVAASALSEPTVAVSGLPSGLKFTAKPVTSKVGTGKAAVTVTNVPPNTIYGAPTSASKTDKNGNVTPSKVKVTVTTAGKSKVEYVIDLTVDPLPALAQGEFSGLALTKIRKDGIVTTTRWGSASLTVGSAGKISGKMIVNGTNCTFTAASYDSFRKGTTEDDWQATATCSLKIGKQVVPMGLTVVAGGAFVEEDDLTAGLFRNSWKDKGAKPVPEEYQGAYSVRLASDRFRTGYLSLTVDKKGAVKVAGKAPDGTVLSAAATLVPAVDPEGAAYYFADIFAAPSDYKGGYVAGTVNFLADRTLSGYVEWRSYNPQSTGDYEKGGFDRALDCSGAKYDKNALLPDLGYGTLALSAFGVREELFITVDQTGKKFVVADKGDAKLTFSFTQSTGIWKGSYLMWPDPSSTKSVNVSFEGILVSGEKNLNGFGTYDATSSYPTYDRTGKKTGEKSYKFKESVPVSFTNQP